MLHDVASGGIHVGVVEECQMACAEVQLWCQAQLKVGVDAQFAYHTHVETGIPAVLLHGYELFAGRSCLVGDELRASVHKLHVLQMCAHDYSKVEWPEVDIWLVLHLALLCRCTQQTYAQQHNCC